LAASPLETIQPVLIRDRERRPMTWHGAREYPRLEGRILVLTASSNDQQAVPARESSIAAFEALLARLCPMALENAYLTLWFRSVEYPRDPLTGRDKTVVRLFSPALPAARSPETRDLRGRRKGDPTQGVWQAGSLNARPASQGRLPPRQCMRRAPRFPPTHPRPHANSGS